MLQVSNDRKIKIVTPTIIPRAEHIISRANISENAVKVLYRLKKAGYQAYLVGGGVRDLLLGREPKDFDVATDATPEDVKHVFRNCRLIGRRFRLAHVHFGREIIEVATFRAGHEVASDQAKLDDKSGMLLRDNVYGTIEEDAMRRDFTVNALYYNIEDFSVVDFADGLKDLQAGVLRLLGDPEQRYREDPVRMLRAARFAAKLGFTINPACEKPLLENGNLLDGVPAARLFDELLKLFLGGSALYSFEKLRHFDLFRHLFPETDECLAHEEQGFPITFVTRGLENTDTRIREEKPVTPAFLFAVLLWEPVRLRAQKLEAKGESKHDAMLEAGSAAISQQVRRVSIPKRFSLQMREIWNMQHRLEQRGKRALRLLAYPRFRAAYDFLLLRAESGEIDTALAAWWTLIQEVSEDERIKMATATGGGGKTRRRRKPRKRPAAE